MKPYKIQKKPRLYFMDILVFISFLIATICPLMIHAQDIELQDMIINTEETYSTNNSIIAGPNFTIGNNGKVTFKAGEMIILNPEFVVVENGQFIGISGEPTSIDQDINTQLPVEFALKQNYPNPFNPVTVISWQLAEGCHVELSIYNNLGQKIISLLSEEQTAGSHQIEWNADGFPSSIYFYRIQAGDFVQTKRMLLIK